jgi:acyl-CoA synthetase (AMP-forming)/AMP-acid ligase II
VHIGGAVAYAPLLVRIRMLICNNVYCGYGSTEGGTVAYAAAEAVFGIDRAVGITAPWVTMEVVDEQNKLQDYGTAGQVRLRALGQGYRYRKKDDGYDIEEADWFYPGDQGTLYRNGLLLILGRVNELINRGGVKVAPDTIEEEMKKHPAVTDAAAVSVLDPVGIEQIWVAIVSSDGSEINVTTMYEHCRTQMPLYVPDRIFQVQSIPRNQLGKVSRVPLSEQLKALESSHVLAVR